MLRHREPALSGAPLILNVLGSLGLVRQFIWQRGFGGQGHDCREFVRTFANDHSYVDFSARRIGKEQRVLLEFGMLHAGERRLLGFFDAFWDSSRAAVARIEAAQFEGVMVDVDVIGHKLLAYVELPLVSTEASVLEADS
jgi:hypothetical protein